MRVSRPFVQYYFWHVRLRVLPNRTFGVCGFASEVQGVEDFGSLASIFFDSAALDITLAIIEGQPRISCDLCDFGLAQNKWHFVWDQQTATS